MKGVSVGECVSRACGARGILWILERALRSGGEAVLLFGSQPPWDGAGEERNQPPLLTPESPALTECHLIFARLLWGQDQRVGLDHPQAHPVH